MQFMVDGKYVLGEEREDSAVAIPSKSHDLMESHWSGHWPLSLEGDGMCGEEPIGVRQHDRILWAVILIRIYRGAACPNWTSSLDNDCTDHGR